MSSDDNEFEVLASTQDYLKLQSRCHELETLQQQLSNENRDLSLKLFDLKEQNTEQQKKIGQLTDNIKYLSQEGIQMSKTLLDLEEEGNKIKSSMMENEKTMAGKYKNALQANQEIENKLISMITENTKVKDELKLKAAQLEKIKTVQKMSRHIQVGPKNVDTAIQSVLTSAQIQQQQQKISKLEGETYQCKDLIKNLQITIQQNVASSKSAQNTINKLTQKVKQCQAQICKFQNQKQQLLVKSSQKQKLLLQQNKKLATQISKCKQNQVKLQNVCKQKQAELNHIKLQLNHSAEKVKVSEQKICQLQSNYANMNAKLQKSQKNNANNQKTIAELKKVQGELTAKSNSLKCQLQQKIKVVKEFQVNTEYIKNTLIALQKQACQFKVQREYLTAQACQKERQLKQQHEINNQLKYKIQKLQCQLDEFNQKKSMLQQQIACMNQQMIVLKKVISECNQKIMKSQKNQSGQNSKTALMQEKNRELSERVALFQTQNQKMSQKLIESQRVTIQLKAKINQITLLSNKFEESTTLQSAKIVEMNTTIKLLQNINNNLKQQHESVVNKLKAQVKQITESKAIMEKQYEDVITAMEAESQALNRVKSKDKPQQDELKQVKNLIQEYFTGLALKLYDLGNLDQQDIAGILVQQQETVKQFISDAIQPFIKNSKISHPHSQPQPHKFK